MVRVLPKNDGPTPKIYVCAADADRGLARTLCQWLDAAGLQSWSRVTKISGPSEGADSIIPKAKIFLLLATQEARTAPLVLFDLRRAFLSGTPIVGLAIGQEGLEVARRINHPCAALVEARAPKEEGAGKQELNEQGLDERGLEERGLEDADKSALLAALEQAMRLSLRQRLALFYARLFPSDAALQEPFRFDPWPVKPKKGEPGYQRFSPLLIWGVSAALVIFGIVGFWVLKPLGYLDRVRAASDVLLDPVKSTQSNEAAGQNTARQKPVDPKRTASLVAAQQMQIQIIEFSPVFVQAGKNVRTLKLIVSNPSNQILNVPPIIFQLFSNDVQMYRQQLEITRPVLGPGEDMELTQDIVGLPNVDGQIEVNFEPLL
jgi:hypothetical protein